jgi:hypothetical protein
MSNNVFGVTLDTYNLSRDQLTREGVITKGSGKYSYPIAITSGNIRPFTNRDPTNNIPQKFGLPRPLKWQYRKGTTTHPYIIVMNPDKPDEYIEASRISKSSKTQSLIGQTMDQPGRFSVKRNPETEITGSLQLNNDCQKCYGIGLVADYAPNRYLTDNPEPCVTNPKLCCNQEYKAKKMVIYANTNLRQNYYTTHYQYLQNRCQTYEQKAFNFKTRIDGEIENKAKPGSPLAISNTYIANCYPNTDEITYSQINIVNRIYQLLKSQSNIFTENDITKYESDRIDSLFKMNQYLSSIEGNKDHALRVYYNYITNPYIGVPLNGPSNPIRCKRVIYKPSNYQYAVEGGVSSSARLLKLTTDTISTNIASIRRLSGSSVLSAASGNPFIYKNKHTTCNNGNTTYMRYSQNRKGCSSIKNTPEFQRINALNSLGNVGGTVNGTLVADTDMTNSFN